MQARALRLLEERRPATAEQAFQLADTLFQTTDVRGGNHLVIGTDGFMAAFGHQSDSSKNLAAITADLIR